MSMEASVLQDLSDDADYAASQQHGSASMIRCESEKRCLSSEHEGAEELIYLKDVVAIRPTQLASERISGRLKLTKQSSLLFLSWIPYTGQTSNAKLSEKDRSLYTITAVPFTQVRSIKRHTPPALGCQYVIVLLSSGLELPPLYFYNGGVTEFLAIVKQHVYLARSAEDASVFLVNDFRCPLQRTLSSLELPSSLPVASGQSTYPSDGLSSNENKGRTSAGVDIDVPADPLELGVSALGQHFADRVEHVPIKKRRFMVCSPLSARREGAEPRVQINLALPVSRLNPNLIDGKTPDVRNEKPDCSGIDFSGIAILADVACSIDMSSDLAPAVDRLLVEEPVVASTVEGNDSSVGPADVSQKCTAFDSSDLAGQGKNDIVAPQKSSVETLSNDVADEQSLEHRRVTSAGMIAATKTSTAHSDESSTERPNANMEASESEHLAPDSRAVTVSEKSSADEAIEKNNEALKDVRLHWDLNVTMDAWGQPCDVEDEASGRDVEGEIAVSIAPKESEHIDGSKVHIDGVVESDGHANISSPSGPKVDAAVRNGKECQSGYDSQFEDGELREPYPWEENEGDAEEVEQLDYGSEPEDERFYSMVESNDDKMKDSEKGILAETNFGSVKSESGDALRIGEANEGSVIEKHVVVCMNDSNLKKGSSSPSRSFVSKPFKELPSHDANQRRRPDDYKELSRGPEKFIGRDDRSGMRMRNRSPGRGYFSGWDSKRRFSPPNYKGGSYGFGRPRPKGIVDDRGMMDDFDQSGSGPGPGPGSGPDGHVRRQFTNGGYRGRFRRFPDEGDRDFRGPYSDNNQYPGRMHNRMSGNRRERGNSPVFRRLHYPQSESRSRSRSPVSWNGRNRSSPPPGGFRADERMMERVRLPFQKRFPSDQEMGFMSPPRNRMSSPRFFEGRNKNDARENHNSFRERKFQPGQRFDVGNSMRRMNSDNNLHLRPFIRHRRFDGAEENTGGNRFEMAQQRNRRSEATEDGRDDVRRFRLNAEQPVVVTTNNNNIKECHENK